MKTVFVSPDVLEQAGYFSSTFRDNIQNEEQAYARVPIIFRAVRLVCDTLKQVPIHIYQGVKKIDAYPFQKQQPLKDLIWKTQASKLLRGGSLIIKLEDEADNNIGYQLLAPFTWLVKREKINGQMETVFEQQIAGKRFPENQDYWHMDEVIYMREYSPADDIGVGISPASNALNSARLQRYIMRFATHFFEHGAMPVALASLPENVDPSVRQETQSLLQTAMSGLKRAFSVVAVNGQIDIKKFTPDLNTLAMSEIREHALEEVAWAFDIPKTILSAESNNYATAEEERKTFINGTINAACESMEEAFNPALAELEEPCRIEFAVDEMHEMQVDEWRRSQAYLNYINGGMPIRAAAAQVGIEIDEAMMNDTGVPANTPQPQADPTVKAELARWMMKAVKRSKEGRNVNVEFKTDVLPLYLQEKIKDGLKQVKSENEIKQLFQQVNI
jgi:HK97 family phage portal protein